MKESYHSLEWRSHIWHTLINQSHMNESRTGARTFTQRGVVLEQHLWVMSHMSRWTSELYHTCQRVMSMWLIHICHTCDICDSFKFVRSSTCESCHTYQCHTYQCQDGPQSYITRVNMSCRTCQYIMPRMWMSHVTYMNESCHTYEWVMSQNVSCHACQYIMSRMWMSHVTYMNESCDT